MQAHKDTFKGMDELGLSMPPYRPTYPFEGDFIDDAHRFYAQGPSRKEGFIQVPSRRWLRPWVKGWLRREDALKLYEMAYFAKGDILEIGMFNGLSTSVLSTANKNSGQKKRITSVDLDPGNVKTSIRNLKAMDLIRDVTHHCSDAVVYAKKAIGEKRRFAFAFIDHSHTYQDTYDLCLLLSALVLRDGFCLFHDFNDVRNADPADDDYGVVQGVEDAFDEKDWEFYGIYGCTGLYRRIGS